jgi:hypothetical protein
MNKIVIKNYQLENVSDLQKMSVVLKNHIIENKLFTPIAGKNYAHVEGWQFAGGLLGLYPKIVKVENLSNENEIKWLAEVEIINSKTKEIISKGFGLSSSKEAKRRGQDEYSVLSMAQTRAIGKAYRNILGWIMKLAGYEPMPAEEAEGVKSTLQKEKTIDDGYVSILAEIGKSKTEKRVKDIYEKLKKSKIYNDLSEEQKQQIEDLVQAKLDQLDLRKNEQNKNK